MWTLGEYLKNSISFVDTDDQAQFEEFKTIFDAYGDLERCLNEINLRPNVLGEIVKRTWEMVNQKDLAAFDRLLSDPTQFPLCDLITHFLQTAGKKMSIITTNYDRIVEYACGLASAFICNGYSPFYAGHFSGHIHSNSFQNLRGYRGQVNLWKVHGSLDWFKNKDGNEINIAMRANVPEHYRPSIVTPGVTKYYETHGEPYRTIFTQADTEIEEANGFLCIGYGFNDDHVQPKLISQIRNNKPIIVITKQLTQKTIESVIGNNCKNYVLLEEDRADPANTKVYSSALGESIIPNADLWSLQSYLNIIR